MGRRIGIIGFSLYLCITFTLGDKYYSNTRPFTPKQEVITNLHFFFHDTLTSPNPSAVLIAKPTLIRRDNNSSPTPFGSLLAIDDPLTVGPDLKSKKIGNARGMYVSSGQHVPTLTMYVDFGFTSGKFKGSSIAIFSRNTITEKEREVAVVGGRGRFRMARGVALLNTYSVNLTNGDAIVEYNVTLYHY